MTLVVAHQLGDRIVMFADTMISDRGLVRQDITPGQLKLIVLGMKLSVAYAGHDHRGRRAARACKAASEGGGLPAVLEILATASADRDCDFLVAAHEGGAALLKVQGGHVSAPQTTHWLGDPKAVRLYLDELARRPATEIEQPFPASKEEVHASAAFTGVLIGSTRATDSVGGFSMKLLASPYGHTYQMHASAYRAGPVLIGDGPSPRPPSKIQLEEKP